MTKNIPTGYDAGIADLGTIAQAYAGSPEMAAQLAAPAPSPQPTAPGLDI